MPDGDRLAAERDEPWPGGRTNHYLFDMNRDWIARSQPETRGREQISLDYFPHVVVDLHEMGGEGTYYFAPPADPINPYITASQTKWLDTFGRANAARFDERGFAYFIREVYDSFYPGYGESWPMYQGAIGMTYEQASARGLVLKRDRRLDADVPRRHPAPLQLRPSPPATRPRRTASSCCATSTSTAGPQSATARRPRRASTC